MFVLSRLRGDLTRGELPGALGNRWQLYTLPRLNNLATPSTDSNICRRTSWNPDTGWQE
jgi:hypothetical protein